MAIDLYACSKADWTSQSNAFISGNKLPSPISLKRSDEQIWSEDTGRTAGSNAKMIGESLATKKTYVIQWGILTSSQMSDIRDALTTGFFKFGYGLTLANATNVAITAYRSEIQGEIINTIKKDGSSGIYYKNASVSVIEQ